MAMTQQEESKMSQAVYQVLDYRLPELQHKGAQYRPRVGIFQRRTAWCLSFLIALGFAQACGDWSDKQAERVQILGEPVDEVAVLDAVAMIMGGSDMHPFVIWFSDKPVINPTTHEKKAGLAYLCTRKEQVQVYVPSGTRCIFNTSLVHELVHRYDRYVRGTACAEIARNPHPVELFGACGDGGLVGEIDDRLREKHCPGAPKPPMRICAASD
jgi:hypothetical protein